MELVCNLSAIAVLVGICIQAGVYYPKLPETCAVHWDTSGKVDGTMSKDGLVAMYISISVALFGMFVLLSKTVSHNCCRPHLNLPNRDYWLSPGREAATLAYIRRYFQVQNIGLLLFLFLIFQQVFYVNSAPAAGEDATLSMAYTLTVGFVYVAFVVGSIIAMLLRFRMPRDAPLAGS